jgi:hypothetical protein
MPDLVKSNLEPIEESDFNLEGKFKGENFSSQDLQEKPLFDVEKEKAMEISAGEKDSSYHEVLSKIQTAPSGDLSQVADDALDASKKIDATSQLQHLLDLASQKGVVYAAKVAKHLDDNYVLDTFHDKLVSDEFNEALVKSGMIERL